jgi:hypothetical protein
LEDVLSQHLVLYPEGLHVRQEFVAGAFSALPVDQRFGLDGRFVFAAVHFGEVHDPVAHLQEVVQLLVVLRFRVLEGEVRPVDWLVLRELAEVEVVD